VKTCNGTLKIVKRLETANLTKSTRFPLFSGLRKDFQVWWVIFIAYASVGNFLAALHNGGESTVLPSSETEPIDETTNVAKKLQRQNRKMRLLWQI
jgi:hypothetical protein